MSTSSLEKSNNVINNVHDYDDDIDDDIWFYSTKFLKQVGCDAFEPTSMFQDCYNEYDYDDYNLNETFLLNNVLFGHVVKRNFRGLLQ